MTTPEYTKLFKCTGCPTTHRMEALCLPEGWVELTMEIGNGTYLNGKVVKTLCPVCVRAESRMVTAEIVLPREELPLQLPASTPKRRRVSIPR